MEHYAGMDVSLESTSVCIVEAHGKILKETKVASEPEAQIAWFAAHEVPMARIGLEAGPLSQWLFAGMKAAGLAVELLDAPHLHPHCEVRALGGLGFSTRQKSAAKEQPKCLFNSLLGCLSPNVRTGTYP